MNVLIDDETTLLDDVYSVRAATLRFERFDGTMSPVVRRLSFERGDGAAALLYDRSTKELVLVRQFRYPTHAKGPGWLVELVAGSVPQGESPEETIRREVLEETGYRPDAIRPISTFYASPGACSERVFLYYAEVDASSRVGPGQGVASEHEDIQEVRLTANEAERLVSSPDVGDAKTLVALHWWLARPRT